jgi:uncharacterized membrane-anchored protein YitT (DUF2179 family)
MKAFRQRSRARRTLVSLVSTAAFVAVTTLAPAQTSPTATPTATPAAGVVPCTTFTSFDVHDGKVYARSTSNPNDQGQEVHAGFAITFACGALPVVTATTAATSGLLIGGIIAAVAVGVGLGAAAAAGGFNGGGSGPTPPVTGFR